MSEFPDSTFSNEKPLQGAAKASLIIAACLTIALFYGFVGVSILLLLFLLLVELIIFLVLIRFGMSRLISPLMQQHGAVLSLLFRSIWLKSGRVFQVPLGREEAPVLFGFLEKLSREFQITMPRKILIEMNSGAWVQLHGFRKGAATTTLGLGFDLLAGLTEREVEAVLAHEMAHAKLVRRGFKRWLNKGVARAGTLTNGLSERVNAYRQSRQSFHLGESLLWAADSCTRLAARFVATYSRQDEFEADAGAARICGAAPLASSLRKLEGIAAKTSRISWNERIAMLQDEKGFGSWLTEELSAAESPGDGGEFVPHFNPYSTHPSTEDRIAAMGYDGGEPLPSSPALQSFANPDAVANKLVAEIHRVLSLEEEKDSSERQKWLKKFRRHHHLRPWQWAGVILFICALIAAMVTVDAEAPAVGLLILLGGLGGGVALYRYGRYHSPYHLPVPDYATLKDAWTRPLDAVVNGEREKILQAECDERCKTVRKKKKRIEMLVGECYAALAACDYLKAHVAARKCLTFKNKCVEAQLGLAIASAACAQGQQAASCVRAVNVNSSFRENATLWGGAWALFLMQDWTSAESFLLELLQRRPAESTFAALLAICQSNRGKLQSALVHARSALAAVPEDLQRIKLLANLLLDGGYLREARIVLAGTESNSEDEGLDFCLIRLHLLEKCYEEAEERLEQLRKRGVEADLHIKLAWAFEAARRDATAVLSYQTALELGHYPEAQLGLARMALLRKEKETARQHLVSALNGARSAGSKGRGALEIFSAILGQFLCLEEPATNLKAWIGHFSHGAPVGVLAGQAFLVYANDTAHAESFVQTIANALLPDQPPFLQSHLQWKTGAKDQQPIGAVRPGIQRYWKQV